jgi:hypothetical protein
VKPLNATEWENGGVGSGQKAVCRNTQRIGKERDRESLEGIFSKEEDSTG